MCGRSKKFINSKSDLPHQPIENSSFSYKILLLFLRDLRTTLKRQKIDQCSIDTHNII